MKKLRVLFLVALIGLSFKGLFYKKEAGPDVMVLLRSLFPDREVSENQTPVHHYRLSGGLVAYNSMDIVSGIRGYAGPLSVLVVLTSDGRIKALKVIQHNETPNYVHYLFSEEYLNTFVGKSVTEPFVPGQDVDAVSRATVSLRALCSTLRVSSRKVAKEVLHIQIGKVQEVHTRVQIKPFVFIGWFGFVFGYYLITRSRKSALRYRRWVLLGSVLVVGVYLSGFFSVVNLLQLTLGQWSFRWQWVLVVGLTGLSFLIAGRFYCGWLCPFGALTEALRGRLTAWRVSFRTDQNLRVLKYYLVLALVGAGILGLRPSQVDFEPYLTMFSFRGNLLTWGIVVVSLLAGLRLPRLWCRYLCPVGALGGLLDRPDRGYKGSVDCPVGLEEYQPGECIRCNRCYSKR